MIIHADVGSNYKWIHLRQIIILLISFALIGCVEKRQILEYKELHSFETIFNYALHNRESIEFDSTIVALADSLLVNDRFYLRVYDDSVQRIEFENFNPSISKEYIVLYNLNRNELSYIDSSYFHQAYIDSIISHKIIENIKGAIYLYSDSLSHRKDWIKLFSTIDHLLSLYQVNRENYTISTLKKHYSSLDKAEIDRINFKIPIRLAIYFKNPFPPPFQNDTSIKFKVPNDNDTIQ